MEDLKCQHCGSVNLDLDHIFPSCLECYHFLPNITRKAAINAILADAGLSSAGLSSAGLSSAGLSLARKTCQRVARGHWPNVFGPRCVMHWPRLVGRLGWPAVHDARPAMH
jgi:hypothetical protein